MGLDMYLTKRHYVQRWEHIEDEKQFEVSVKQGGKDYPHIDMSKIKNIEEEAGYWRKANAIHGWFVENVQEGVDDCGEYWVSPRQIDELYAACKEVLEDTSKGEELLSTRVGFFFGSTDYDEWYIRDIENTAAICENILNDVDDQGYLPYEVYYQASW
jgi:hypothetical protein